MMHAHLFAFLALVATLQMASAFQVKDCTAGKEADAKMLSLNINSCPDTVGDYCTFIKGSNSTMKLEFEPTKAFSQANILIRAKIGPMYIPFKLNGPVDACGHYGFDCPVKVGQKDQLVISLPVLRVYPSIKTTVRFELNDEQKKPIVCFEFPVQLKSQ